MKMKKRSSGGGANWMDTYGDMVTLLLCFFVLLYSMSTISEENWKALVMSFNPSAVQALHETPGGDGPSADGDSAGVMPSPTDSLVSSPTKEDVEAQMEQLYEALVEYAQQSEMQNTLSITKGDGKVYVTFSDTVFFTSNSAIVREEAYPVLNAVSAMFDDAVEAIDEIRVQGHTAQASPDEPNEVQTDRELSGQRAANVVTYIQQQSKIDPARLISEGYGQWRPVASNDTPEERAKNRRVEMIISGRDIAQELEAGQAQHGVSVGISEGAA